MGEIARQALARRRHKRLENIAGQTSPNGHGSRLATIAITTGATTTAADRPQDDLLSPTSPSSAEALSPKSGSRIARDPETPKKSPAKRSKTSTVSPKIQVEVGPTYDPGPYLVIREPAELEQVLPAFLSAPTIALDTETTGLDPLVDQLRTVQVSTGEQTIIVDVFHVPVAMLGPLLNGERWLIFHHGKFDLKFLVQAGLPWPSGHCFDTMLGAQVLGASTTRAEKGTYSLDGLAQHFLGMSLDKALQHSDWAGELSAEQLRYAAADAAVLLPLAKTLRTQLKATRLWKVAELESTCVRALAWMELAGMPLDGAQWRAQAGLHQERKRELALELSALAGREINWNSTHHILTVLHDRGLDVSSTNRETLLAYLADAVIAKLFEYRQAANRAQTYGERWLTSTLPPDECMPTIDN
jgi:DNA polymerase I-like protein with 3'-5' exonuclease and polymerase domains